MRIVPGEISVIGYGFFRTDAAGGVHSPDERMLIPTVDKFWRHLLDVLVNIPACSRENQFIACYGLCAA